VEAKGRGAGGEFTGEEGQKVDVTGPWWYALTSDGMAALAPRDLI